MSIKGDNIIEVCYIYRNLPGTEAVVREEIEDV